MAVAQPNPIQAVGGPGAQAKPVGVPVALAPVIRKEFGPLSPKSFQQDDPFAPRPATFRKSLQSKEDRRTQSEARNQVRLFFLVAGLLVAAALFSLLTFLGSVVFFDGDTKPPHSVNNITTPPEMDRGPNDNTSVADRDDARQSRHEQLETISGDLSSVCGDLSCRAAVSSLRSQLDFRHDPCWDLYDHVCSQWQSAHCDVAAERGGSYSVDDAVLDRYAKTLGSFLITREGRSSVVPDERQFLVECLDGKVPDTDEVEHMLLTDIPENPTSTPEATLAEAIVRMARVGISPFFDVSVELSGDVFRVTLSRPQAIGNDVFRTEESDPASLAPQPGLYRDTEARSAKSESEPLFFQALQSQLCLTIAAVARSNKSCQLSPSSSITPAWNYTWYTTEGLKTLRQSAVSVLKPLAAGKHTDLDRNGSASMLRVTRRSSRMASCMHIIDRYVPNWLSSLSNSSFATEFRNHVNDSLRSLKELIANEIPSARNIKMFFLSSPVTQTKTTAFPPHVGTSGTFTKGSRLETYLKNWTWKRWTQGPNGGLPVLSSTTSAYLKSSQTLYVPLGAFNWSNTDSPLLRYLDLSRAGPRVLGTLFVERLSEEFKDSRLFRCLTSYLGEVQVLPEETRESRLANMEELASFYLSLAAYRSHVAAAFAFSPVNRMMTDALFLLYYAFNNCEAVFEPDGSASPPRARRRKVESVARIFSSALLQECSALPNVLSSCGY